MGNPEPRGGISVAWERGLPGVPEPHRHVSALEARGSQTQRCDGDTAQAGQGDAPVP